MYLLTRAALRSALPFVPALLLGVGLGSSASAQSPAPAPDACITDLSPTAPNQARTVRCQGDDLTFFVAVPPGCERGGCGLIVDLPGATQTAAAVNMNTGLRVRARNVPNPFIVINAQNNSNGGGAPIFVTRSPGGDDDEIFAFMKRAAKVFAADMNRIHIGGFSQGGILSFNFLCDPEKAAFIASAAPAAGFPGQQGSARCFGAGQRNSATRAILFFSGRQDRIAPFQGQASAAMDIVAGMGPIASTTVIDSGANGFEQTRITAANGKILELIRHDGTNAGLGGHCFVGPAVQNGGACQGPAGYQMGEKILEFYMANPKRGAAAAAAAAPAGGAAIAAPLQ